MYWLKDAATQTNLVSCGSSLNRDLATPTSLTMYVLDLPSAGNQKVYVYNIRAALTVATGASVSAFVLATGNQAITGTGSQNSNLCIANTSHGLGAGIPSLYFVTTTRFYRIALANITSGSTTFLSDSIAEIPPGGTSTFAITSTLSTIEFIPSIDAFAIGTTNNFSYITKYVASGDRFDKMFGRNMMYLEQSLKDGNHPTIFSNQ